MDQGNRRQRAPNPRETANLFSLVTFSYTRKLFTSGLKKDLEDNDLFEVINRCRSENCTDRLEHAYEAEFTKKKPSILRVLWNCYGHTYVFLGLIHLTWNLISSALEPDAISQLVAYFKPGQTKMTINDAFYYAGVLIGLKLLHTLYHPNYQIYLIQLAIQIRTSFSSLIYRKALKVSPKALENASLGNIVTLITKDVSLFEGAVGTFNEIWVGTIQTFYVCYLIYSRIGYTSAVGVLILSSAVPIQFYVATIIKKLRAKMNKRTDTRLQETQEALSTIKIIKMYTWQKIFADRIGETRRNEVKTLLKKALTRLCLMVCSDFMGKLGFYALVMLYIYLNTTLNPETIFYIMRSYATLRHSVSIMFTFGFTVVAELFASIERINNILQLEELPDHIDKPDDQPQIDIREATFSMKYKDILKNINLKMNAGLNVVTGQLGSGKSSLIKMILRDYPVDSGEIRTRGVMSYASQDPWLFPGTIKQNILFGEHYNYERYKKVIEICALSYDFSILENGDDTVVADRGMNLSKGQQARINLARAIYKESDIYLIDDSLTALDPKVQNHIFNECIQSFLKNKLVMLVTHNPKHISKADIVIILEDGGIKFAGKKQEVSDKLLAAIEEEITEKQNEQATEDQSKEDEATETSNLLPDLPTDKQIYHENKKSGTVAHEVYSKYVQYGGGYFFLIFLVLVFAAATFSEGSSQIMLTNWVNYKANVMSKKEQYLSNSNVSLKPLFESYFQSYFDNKKGINHTDLLLVPESNWTTNNTLTVSEALTPLNYSDMSESQNKTFYLLAQIGREEILASKSLHLYTILSVVAIVLEFFKQYFVFKFGTKASINIHKDMVTKVIFGKMAFFDTFFIGNILNRFSQDLSVVDESLPMNLNVLIMATFGFVGIIGVIASVSWKFVVPAIGIILILIILRRIYMPTARSLKRLEAATRSPIVGHLNSTMEGLTTVRAYKAQPILKHEFDRHQDVYTSAKYTSVCVKNAFLFFMETTSVLFNVFIICRFLFWDTESAAGDVGLTLTAASTLTVVLQFGLLQWSEVENLMTSVERVMEYTKIDPEVTTGLETPNWPTAGKIVYKDVSLKYTKTNEKVLKNINFTVEPQEKIGIVGRTGAGKSSIISTLFRLYDHEGTITIDDVDTKTLSLNYLRQHISIIPQDPIMFSGTIRTNIDPLKEFADEEIWKVLHKVNLDSKVPNLDTQVEDTNFSSGERQLLSIARAIVRRNKIVVLDEATANMDHETEKMVQKAIDDNFGSCTVFIIAHRLDSILNCNKVMVLNKGEIIEYNDPKTLLSKKNSSFSKMLRYAKLAIES
ncbi:probable multidrug resistance-associated protein lethal(2)03659 [Diabrotica virgifera virgifera]|uniref:Multidrug resistance-associated protein lethal(2)03659 n=1 Tax=Diabrotica virgifera virgifera TaxID=50390 RepID=A0ABM5KBE1_DIAVI|nr:probable multidrug resistance-associated protein lethal(2)03659 [Diabrotica virgifera virgifera]